MRRKKYYLHKRNGIYYVEYIDKASGKKLTARSTGETDYSRAEEKANQWLYNGIPTGEANQPRSLEEFAEIEGILKAIRKADLNSDDALRIVTSLKTMGLIDISAIKNTGRGAVPFIQFLESFWDYDKSDYVQDKLSRGESITRNFVRRCKNRVIKDLKPFFGEIKLNAVSTDDLKKFVRQLADRGLSTSTRKQTLSICSTPLRWAFEEKLIPVNPAVGVGKFSITNKERGALEEAEATAFFSADWEDRRAYCASLVACTTGARQGEILALRLSDIKEKTLSIAHSYSPFDGIKNPKNGHKRIAPLLPEVKAALLDLAKENPFDTSDPFIFYSMRPDKPTDPHIILRGLYDIFEKNNIDYKERNIDFHSWRHYFCSKITEIITGEIAAKVSGHLSPAVFNKYASHIETKNILRAYDAAAQAFGNVLQFRKVG